jgi:hypothetical protein
MTTPFLSRTRDRSRFVELCGSAMGPDAEEMVETIFKVSRGEHAKQLIN